MAWSAASSRPLVSRRSQTSAHARNPGTGALPRGLDLDFSGEVAVEMTWMPRFIERALTQAAAR
jgi:hypothetical protein